jgi:hypothetical protein
MARHPVETLADMRGISSARDLTSMRRIGGSEYCVARDSGLRRLQLRRGKEEKARCRGPICAGRGERYAAPDIDAVASGVGEWPSRGA